jgi:hypothetical protein
MVDTAIRTVVDLAVGPRHIHEFWRDSKQENPGIGNKHVWKSVNNICLIPPRMSWHWLLEAGYRKVAQVLGKVRPKYKLTTKNSYTDIPLWYMTSSCIWSALSRHGKGRLSLSGRVAMLCHPYGFLPNNRNMEGFWDILRCSDMWFLVVLYMLALTGQTRGLHVYG